MASGSKSIILPEQAISAFTEAQNSFEGIHVKWTAALKKPDLCLGEPLADVRLLVDFMSLIHLSDHNKMAEWVDKNKQAFLGDRSDLSLDEQLKTASLHVIKKFDLETDKMTRAIDELQKVTTSAKTEQVHFQAIKGALEQLKETLGHQEEEQERLVASAEDNVKKIQASVDGNQDLINQKDDELAEEVSRAKDLEQATNRWHFGFDSDGGALSRIVGNWAMQPLMARLAGEMKLLNDELNVLKENLKSSTAVRDEANSRLLQLRKDKAAAHSQFEAAAQAITSCGKLEAESGAAYDELNKLHAPWMSIKDSVHNLATWTASLKQKSGFSERLVFEARVLKLANVAIALQDEAGVHDACSQIVADIAARNDWNPQAVVKAGAEESVHDVFVKIKGRLGLDGPEKRSLQPLQQDDFPDMERLIEFS